MSTNDTFSEHLEIDDECRHYLRSIIDSINDPITIIDSAYNVKMLNKAAQNAIDPRFIADMRYPHCYEIAHHRQEPCHGVDHPCPLERVVETKKRITVIHRRPQKDGSERLVEVTVSPLWDTAGKFLGVMEAVRDITSELQMKEKLRLQQDITDHQAHHDGLTGLSNRTLLLDRLQESIKKAIRTESKVAVLFIDMDHFKEINDSFGRESGDEALKTITTRLQGIIRQSDALARIGGDEFAIIINDRLKVSEVVIDIVHKIMQIMREPFVIEGHSLYATLSIGIALYPNDGDSAEALLKNADTAMHKAKDEGRNTYQFYDEEMTERAFERIVMETSLRHALDAEEFVVYYQPQIDANSDHIIGMEALVRWEHESMGLVSPAKFIHLAEETGLIVDLDRQVMRTAMEQVTAWYAEGFDPGPIALNLAMKQLLQADFIPFLQELLAATGCRPEWLQFEVTESHIMQRPKQSIETLKRISDLGILLAIDDFGTGHSSLAYLKHLPIDKLKIDRSFVIGLPEDEHDIAITHAVIALARNMRMSIIAEGVETEGQRDFLIRSGCSDMQGFLYSRPISAEQMTEMLKR